MFSAEPTMPMRASGTFAGPLVALPRDSERARNPPRLLPAAEEGDAGGELPGELSGDVVAAK